MAREPPKFPSNKLKVMPQKSPNKWMRSDNPLPECQYRDPDARTCGMCPYSPFLHLLDYHAWQLSPLLENQKAQESFFAFLQKRNIVLCPTRSSVMEANVEEIAEIKNLFQSEEEQEQISLGKRKINSVAKIESDRETKRIAFLTQECLEEEEDIDMTESEEYVGRDDHVDNKETIMEDCVIEEECVVDFDGFF